MESYDENSRFQRGWRGGSLRLGGHWTCQQCAQCKVQQNAPMPVGSFGSTAAPAVLEIEAFGVAASALTMVDVDDERLKVLVRGARWVSFSSTVGLASRFGGARSVRGHTLCELPRHDCERA